MAKDTKVFSAGLKKDLKFAQQDLANLGKAAAAAGIALYTGLAVGVAKSIEQISNLKDEADKVGASAEGFMLLTSAAQKSGAGAENMRKAMSELTKSLGEAFQAGSATADEFTRLGIDIQKLNAMSGDKQFLAVAAALNQVGDKTERARIGTALLGKEYTQLAILIKEIDSMDVPVGMALKQSDIENIKAAGESWDNLKQSVTGVFNIISAGFAPILKAAFDGAADGIADVLKNSGKLIDILSGVATPLLMVVGALDYIRAGVKLGEVSILKLGEIVSKVFGSFAVSILDGVDAIMKLANAGVDVINKFAGKKIMDNFNTDFLTVTRNQVNDLVDVFVESREKAYKEFQNMLPEGSDSYLTKTTEFLSTGIAGAVKAAASAGATAIVDAKKVLEQAALTPTATGYKNDDPLGLLNMSKKFGDKENSPLGQIKTGLLDIATTSEDITGALGSKQTALVTKMNMRFTNSADDIKDALKKVTDEADKALTRLGDSMTESMEKPAETYYRTLSNIALLLEKNKISQDTANRAQIIALEELTKQTNVFLDAVSGFGNNLAEGFTDAILGAKSFGEALHDILANVAKDILNVIMKQFILKSLFNSVGGSLFGVAGLGQMMYGGPRANGGPVSAGTAYTVGEVGPETFVPQTNGYILPNGVGQGGGVTVVQNINVQSGVNRAEVMSLFPRLKAETLNAVIEARARGGAMSRGITA